MKPSKIEHASIFVLALGLIGGVAIVFATTPKPTRTSGLQIRPTDGSGIPDGGYGIYVDNSTKLPVAVKTSNVSDAIVTVAATQTLTSKALTAPVIAAARVSGAVVGTYSIGTNDGGVLTVGQATIIRPGGTVEPTCNLAARGAVYTVAGADGGSDVFAVCMKAAADTYAWQTVLTAP